MSEEQPPIATESASPSKRHRKKKKKKKHKSPRKKKTSSAAATDDTATDGTNAEVTPAMSSTATTEGATDAPPSPKRRASHVFLDKIKSLSGISSSRESTVGGDGEEAALIHADGIVELDGGGDGDDDGSGPMTPVAPTGGSRAPRASMAADDDSLIEAELMKKRHFTPKRSASQTPNSFAFDSEAIGEAVVKSKKSKKKKKKKKKKSSRTEAAAKPTDNATTAEGDTVPNVSEAIADSSAAMTEDTSQMTSAEPSPMADATNSASPSKKKDKKKKKKKKSKGKKKKSKAQDSPVDFLSELKFIQPENIATHQNDSSPTITDEYVIVQSEAWTEPYSTKSIKEAVDKMADDETEATKGGKATVASSYGMAAVAISGAAIVAGVAVWHYGGKTKKSA